MRHYELLAEAAKCVGDRAMQFLLQFLSIQTLVGFLIGYGLRAFISQLHRAEARRARSFY